jgi:two-component system NtrC family sensor kinase
MSWSWGPDRTVGESIVELSRDYKNLTFTAPRVVLGRAIYPDIESARSDVVCGSSRVECHFYLDLMQLDLAISYENVANTLRESNKQLESAVKKLKLQQSQLVQSEKMASLGLLAAGVAHEINNPVGFIQSNLATLGQYLEVMKNLIGVYRSLAECMTKEGVNEARQKIFDIEAIEKEEDLTYILEDTEALIAESRNGTARISEIVKGLKSFSRAEGEKPRDADINECIESTLKMVWNEIKYHCEVEKDFGEIPHLMCFSGELSQVFVNLLTNAAQTISGSGKIRVATALVDEQIEIRVTDIGSGIDPEHLADLFSAFFTTKPEGQGTGLGLSISYSIVEKHGGSITVESEKGKGSTFIIRLPLEGGCDALSSEEAPVAAVAAK